VLAQQSRGTNALSWSRSFTLLASINDLQSTSTTTVYNTTGCVWNDQDELTDAAKGKLSAGLTISDTLCAVTDWCSDSACPHMVYFQISAGPGLQVQLTSNRGGLWRSPPPVKNGSDWIYQLCFPDPLWDPNNAVFPLVPGTNGGEGFVTNYTLTLTATKTGQIAAAFGIGQNRTSQLSGIPCPEIN
jgi:hypothetical protein